MSTVLILDDSAVSLEQCSEPLRVRGHAVIEAQGADECVQLVMQHQPHVIVARASVSVAAGLDWCKKIVSSEIGAYIPIIFVAEVATDAQVIEALDGPREVVARACVRLATYRKQAGHVQAETAHHDDDEMPTNEGEGYVIMLVEARAGLQNAVRERLKSRGYRVLVISDPNRALSRFSVDEEPPADCVIFGASELGMLAMEAFNQFGVDAHTAEIPAVLLVDQRLDQIVQGANSGPKRKLLSLPLKVRELRAALLQLLVGVDRRPIGTY